ncbi:MAG: type II secretion system protein GspD [Planctomycetota bacterium]
MHERIKMYHRNYICLFLAISLFISPFTVSAGQTALKTGREKLRTKVTHSWVEQPIEKVLMDLADQAEIDIIKGPKVTGNVTAKVTAVPLEEALTNILAVHNCTYIATENMIRVIPLPLQTDLKEPQITRVYKITYADPNQVYEALDDLKTGKGEIALMKGTSHIIVTDEEHKIKAMDKFIEQVDHLTPQVLIEVRIYDVTTREGFELDPRWHLSNKPYPMGPMPTPDEIKFIESSPESSYFKQKRTDMSWNNARQLKYIDGVGWVPWDGYPDANHVSVPNANNSIAPITERIEENWTQEPGRTEIERTYNNPSPSLFSRRRDDFVGGSFDRYSGGSLHISLLDDAIDLNFVLTVLHSQVDARLLANPRILVLDNETANFEIVRETPYREFQQVGRLDPISYTAFKNIGVDLKVTPHIARDGMLRLHIVPKFSTLVSQIPSGDLSQLPAPTVDARRVDTKAMIRDGQTIVLGGLRKREISKGISKVPVLCDIPLVGGLFKSETESKVIKELIVFITARIVTDPTLSEREQELLGETEFKMPQIEKTRIEKGQFNNSKAEESEITDSLDLLLKKLEPEEE